MASMSQDGTGSAALAEAMRAGNRAYKSAKYADAARIYAKVLAEDGHLASAWLSLGNARWRRGDRDGAIHAYRRAVEEDPKRARAWHNLSTAWLAGGEFSGAADAASKAVALDPKRAKAWNNLAVARQGLQDPRGAETALRRALEADPDLAVAWGNLGHVVLRNGQSKEAEDAFRRAIAGGNREPDVLVGLARSLVARGFLDAAEVELAAAARAAPSSADLWLALGDVRRARGDAAGALSAYEGASAASVDMADEARGKAARRRLEAGLLVARDAAARGDRAALLDAVEGLRSAAHDAGATGAADGASLAAGVVRCVEAAAKANRDEVPAAWVDEVLSGAVRAASASRPGAAGSGP